MHIAFYSNTYRPVISGVVRSISEFRKALSELGHNVFIFAQDVPGYDDVEPFVFRYPAINFTWPVDFPATIPISPFIDLVLPSLKLDVIHAHHPILLGQTAANKAEELNLPFVFTFHTQYREYSHYFPVPQETVQEFVKEAIVNWLADFLGRCNHIVVPSPSMRDILEREYGIQDRLTVIPTGIDLEPFREADGEVVRNKMGWEDKFVLISIGRLAVEKNWPTLLKASAHAMEKHPQLHTVIIGDGPERKRLEGYTRELGIAERVEFMGPLPFSEIPAHLKAADLFGFASVTETQGLVTMEAMAAGLPIVAVDATGTRDVVEDGVQGLLTENDSQALGKAIKKIVRDSKLRQDCRREALKKIQSLDIRIQAERLVNVYQQAIADKKAGQFVRVKMDKKRNPFRFRDRNR
jgi:1,2-diacylglycerol 3-alpha-glucosyltransferase